MRAVSNNRHGFTLIEALIAVLLVFMVGGGMILSVTVARQRAELDKQRIAAISAARAYMEENVRQVPFPSIHAQEAVTLDNFNTPDEVLDDLEATISQTLYVINPDGTRGAVIATSPTDENRIEVVVAVTWNRTGYLGIQPHSMTETLRTYATPDL